MTPEVVVRGTDALGECPLWDDREEALYWVDGRAPALYRWREGAEKESWPLPEIIGSFAFGESGTILAALQTGLFTLNRASRELLHFASPESGHPDNRFNDGRCDRSGRFWVGTMYTVAREPQGSLYRVSADATSERVFGDVIVPNRLAWSPDNRTMYFADTYRHCIWTFDFDLEAGRVTNKRLFSDLTGQPGRPDGSAVDAEGCLWNCEYAGGRVVRYRPDGSVDRVVTLPVDNPTCCAFGGSDFRTLFITTARQRLSPEQLERQPLAGSVFAIRTDIGGLPEARFAI